ncbi:thiamine phosphate synthase [Paraburkholderia hayleyella]|uniref:thiamine phosphate synthase n=1 Tax=Paraburkholderia hayleyella TaxID=2152889 RepID=UPI001291E3A8|nr:thiamine phosphate synthase [Paraburkholderia hayleyella]
MSDAWAGSARGPFWPPADEQAAVAGRIRARLGDWAPPSQPWCLCLSAPDEARRGDLIVVMHAPSSARSPDARSSLAGSPIARWQRQGAGVIEVVGPTALTLHLDGERYALEGVLSDDWIAALAAFLDCGFAPHDALVLALAWRAGDELSLADPWPVDLARFPRVMGLPAAPAVAFAPCPVRLGLYPVLPTAQWVERVLAFGVKTVQLRRKTAEPAELACEIRQSVAAGRRHDARVFINDHWQAALDAGAYGVHLGQEDLPGADLSALAAAGMRLGLSTHGYYEILRALHYRPSYIALGAVFPTATKHVSTGAQGLARLARYVRLLDGVMPLVAIGGIDAGRLSAVLATGVGSAAVVSAVTGATDSAAAVAALQSMCDA